MRELEFNPDWTSPPGDTIGAIIEERQISRERLAQLICCKCLAQVKEISMTPNQVGKVKEIIRHFEAEGKFVVSTALLDMLMAYARQTGEIDRLRSVVRETRKTMWIRGAARTKLPEWDAETERLCGGSP